MLTVEDGEELLNFEAKRRHQERASATLEEKYKAEVIATAPAEDGDKNEYYKKELIKKAATLMTGIDSRATYAATIHPAFDDMIVDDLFTDHEQNVNTILLRLKEPPHPTGPPPDHASSL